MLEFTAEQKSELFFLVATGLEQFLYLQTNIL